MGLLACPQTPSCGYLEIVMSNEYGEGWANNTLDVYRNGSFYLSIPFYWGDEQTTMIPADNNDEFDFIYLGGTTGTQNLRVMLLVLQTEVFWLIKTVLGKYLKVLLILLFVKITPG